MEHAGRADARIMCCRNLMGFGVFALHSALVVLTGAMILPSVGNPQSAFLWLPLTLVDAPALILADAMSVAVMGDNLDKVMAPRITAVLGDTAMARGIVLPGLLIGVLGGAQWGCLGFMFGVLLDTLVSFFRRPRACNMTINDPSQQGFRIPGAPASASSSR